MSASLRAFLREQRGKRGIYAVCSASAWVIEASMKQALNDASQLLVEATSNQVNQHGGYTGMQPAEFVNFIHCIAKRSAFPVDKLILGGDHLGPNAWQRQDAATAMLLAEEMMRAYVQAGFTKIHLDASMRCADDPQNLSDEIIAERAARLCAAAEAAVPSGAACDISYVVGTEVPTPGGADHALSSVEVTSTQAVEHTHAVHRAAFARAGLGSAWDRVIAIVVQPGVDFDHHSVIDYSPEKAAHLNTFLIAHPELVMEAHSTDYQRPCAFKQLVRDGFAILKVGPALTFAQREGLFGLEEIEEQLLPSAVRSHLRSTLESVMVRDPLQWQRYYKGTPQQQAQLRVYSYSDRIRYYWHQTDVQRSVQKLMANLQAVHIPETLLSQHLPQQYLQVREGSIAATPSALLQAKIRQAIDPYSAATA